MKTYANKAKPAKRKFKPTKEQILEYYHRLSYPHEYANDRDRDAIFVPADLQMKAFEKLLQWNEIKAPATVIDTDKPVKYILEVRTQD